MEMEEYREQEIFTNLKKYLEAQKSNIEMLLDEIEIYTCRNDDNSYFANTFSISCYNRDDFIIFDYRRTVQDNNIRKSTEEVLKILAKKETN